MVRQKQRFDSIVNIELTKLKFYPIIDQTGTYTYKAAKVVSRYLKPLCDSGITIKVQSPLLN